VIRLLLDMGIAQLARLPDDQIVAKAQEEGRAIVTHDLDFGRIVALSGRSVPSVVTLRLGTADRRALSQAVCLALARHPEPRPAAPAPLLCEGRSRRH
jgi:predicted nuclease of predicted toxin-antitoxin system